MSSKKEPAVLNPPSTETNTKETPSGPLPNNQRTITPEAARELARKIIACIGSPTPLPYIRIETTKIFRTYYPQKPKHDQEDLVIVATGVFDGLSRFVKGVDTEYEVGSGLVQAYQGIAKRFAKEYVDESIRASCSKEESDAVQDDVAVFAILAMLFSSLLGVLGMLGRVSNGAASVAGYVEYVPENSWLDRWLKAHTSVSIRALYIRLRELKNDTSIPGVQLNVDMDSPFVS